MNQNGRVNQNGSSEAPRNRGGAGHDHRHHDHAGHVHTAECSSGEHVYVTRSSIGSKAIEKEMMSKINFIGLRVKTHSFLFNFLRADVILSFILIIASTYGGPIDMRTLIHKWPFWYLLLSVISFMIIRDPTKVRKVGLTFLKNTTYLRCAVSFFTALDLSLIHI
eukprot:TRINITY_DN7392_c0_g1_i11.p1 TRINITY_DN7392_c0_g1~~TRINITY_DN7392_c0_g1_i11.p1  ORF type:complete len:165 (+),score=9.52 TRINITY_DN7392_c0_g1_i11:136-630(+)